MIDATLLFLVSLGLLLNAAAVREAATTFIALSPQSRLSWAAITAWERRSCMAVCVLGVLFKGMCWIVVCLIWLLFGSRGGPAVGIMLGMGVTHGALGWFLARSIRRVGQQEKWLA